MAEQSRTSTKLFLKNLQKKYQTHEMVKDLVILWVNESAMGTADQHHALELRLWSINAFFTDVPPGHATSHLVEYHAGAISTMVNSWRD